MGKTGALILWVSEVPHHHWKLDSWVSWKVPVCMTAFFVVQTALQATSRTIYAFSRDHGMYLWSQFMNLSVHYIHYIPGLPDCGFFGKNSSTTGTPIRAVWLSTFIGILPGLLDLASPIAANAIFSLTAMALDISYIIPIFLRRIYHSHPEVNFKPGPFYLGNGFLGNFCNWMCILWTLFICIIFSLPTVLPVTKENMNYAPVRDLNEKNYQLLIDIFVLLILGNN